MTNRTWTGNRPCPRCGGYTFIGKRKGVFRQYSDKENILWAVCSMAMVLISICIVCVSGTPIQQFTEFEVVFFILIAVLSVIAGRAATEIYAQYRGIRSVNIHTRCATCGVRLYFKAADN